MSELAAASASIIAFPDHVVEQARNRPTAPALLWGGKWMSYGDLHEMVQDTRLSLERLALPEGAHVGILAKKSPQAISSILAWLIVRRCVPFAISEPRR